MQQINPQSIKNILKKFFKENPKITNKLDEAHLLSYWNNCTDPIIRYYTHNVFIKNRTFYAELKSPALKNELMMQREEKVKELNKVVGKSIIDRIVFI
jgi:hypothetical protein